MAQRSAKAMRGETNRRHGRRKSPLASKTTLATQIFGWRVWSAGIRVKGGELWVRNGPRVLKDT